MYEIAKSFSFSASHQLDRLPEGHKCRRLHGHNYTVEIRLTAEKLNEYGFVTDFAELDRVGEWLRAVLDHRHLNDVLTVPPTCEHLARVVFEWCGEHLAPALARSVCTVRIAESAGTWAEYRQDVRNSAGQETGR